MSALGSETSADVNMAMPRPRNAYLTSEVHCLIHTFKITQLQPYTYTNVWKLKHYYSPVNERENTSTQQTES